MKINQYIKQLCSVLMLAAIFTSCTKNLDQTPESTADRDAIFSSEDGLKLYTNSFYNILPDINTPFRTDCNMSDYGATSSVSDFLREGGYTSRQGTGWDWNDLRNINYFIENCTNQSIPQEIRDNYLGIARFFRAYFYFEKMKRFGDVPWINQPLAVDDPALFAGRDARTLITDSIIADLDFAATHITKEEDETRSTITKYIVYGFKSRVCLFEGTFRKYQTSYGLQSTAKDLLQQAADAAKTVMDANIYRLNTAGDSLSYRNLFISAAPVASEIMLADVTSTSLAKYNDANWYFTSSTYGPRFSFIRKFINTYLMRDGSRFTDIPGHDTVTFANEVKSRDLRLQQTIRMGDYKRVTNGTVIPGPPVFSYVYTGYQPIKWCLDDMYYDAGAYNTNSVSLMRYAEILLNYAEAKAELGTITDADWAATVGALRQRAGITTGTATLPTELDPYMHDNYYSDISDPVIMEIRRDRGIELTLEGFRFYDLVRWKHGELLTDKWNGMYVPSVDKPMDLNEDGILDVSFYITSPADPIDGVTYRDVSKPPQTLEHGTYGELHWLDNVSRVWADYKYLYPIPFDDLQLNPDLKQNPGWE